MMERWVSLLLLIGASLVCCEQCDHLHAFIPIRGRIDPASPYRPIYGSSLLVTCDKYCYTGIGNASDISFKLTIRNSEVIDLINPGDSRITLVNTTSAFIYLTNVTRNQSVTCYIQPPGGSKKILNLLTLNDVGYPPSNFSINCIVENYSSMNCTVFFWRDSLVWTVVHFEYRVVSTLTYRPCPWNDSVNNRTCRWMNDPQLPCYDRSDVLLMSQSYDIKVKAVNRHGQLTNTTTVILGNIVKPAPVANLRISTLAPRRLSLQFDVDKYTQPQYFNVSYTSRLHNGSFTTNQTDTQTKTQTLDVPDELLPSVTYTLNMMAKPIVDGYWSDTRSITVTMPTDVPSRSPTLSPGGYKQLECGTECMRSCAAGQRRLCREIKLFWPKIKEAERNGVIIGYKLTVNSSKGLLQEFDTAGFSQSYSFYLLNNETYIIGIRASTEVGPAVMSSYVTIPVVPSELTALTGPVNVAAIRQNETSVLVKWQHGDKSQLKSLSYTIFWCEGDGNQCFPDSENDLFSEQVAGTEKERLVHLKPTLNGPDAFWFGVASSHQEAGVVMSSGMVASKCVYNPDNVLSPPVLLKPSFDISTTISITIKAIECSAKNDVITDFLLLYCTEDAEKPGNCSGNVNMWKVNASTTDVSITENVSAEKDYLVWGRTLTVSGQSEEGEKIKITTTGLTVDQLWSIGIAALIVLVLCGIGIWCCIRRCHRKFKDFRKPIDFYYPESQPNGVITMRDNVIYEDYPLQTEEELDGNKNNEGDLKEVQSNGSSIIQRDLSNRSSNNTSYSRFAIAGQVAAATPCSTSMSTVTETLDNSEDAYMKGRVGGQSIRSHPVDSVIDTDPGYSKFLVNDKNRASDSDRGDSIDSTSGSGQSDPVSLTSDSDKGSSITNSHQSEEPILPSVSHGQDSWDDSGSPVTYLQARK